MGSKSRAPQSRSQGTRARILDAALRLFNDHGTAAISTNHIAEEAGVSPGNLYYHFKDKKQIISELHAQFISGYDDQYMARGGLAQFRHNLTASMRWAWHYRFFQREILALLRADERLREQYLTVYHRRLEEWSSFGQQLVAQGMAHLPQDREDIHHLTLAIWLISESWLSFLDAVDDAQEPEQAARVEHLVLAVLEPYLTDKGRQSLLLADKASAVGTSPQDNEDISESRTEMSS